MTIISYFINPASTVVLSFFSKIFIVLFSLEFSFSDGLTFLRVPDVQARDAFGREE